MNTNKHQQSKISVGRSLARHVGLKTDLHKQSGFTLVEIVVAISILGIIGSLAALMINNTVEGYDALARRAKAQTSIRLAVDRIARELRHALPNSVCTYNGSGCSSAGDRFYFLKSVDAGEYQDQPGTYSSGQAHAPLAVSPSTAGSVDVISNNTLNASANQWLVVYSVDNSNIYSTTNKRKQISSITTKDVDGSAPANDIAVVNFSGSVNFPGHSPARRFHIIENNATLFYLSGTDLYRAQSSFAAPQTPSSGTEQLLLQNVAALGFSYVAGSPQRAGLLRIDITLQQNAETLHLIHEAHVQNEP